jgi:hypothetical protein
MRTTPSTLGLACAALLATTSATAFAASEDEGTGQGPIISVNSWCYTNQPGMAGPRLWGSSAEGVFAQAGGVALGTAGVIV